MSQKNGAHKSYRTKIAELLTGVKFQITEDGKALNINKISLQKFLKGGFEKFISEANTKKVRVIVLEEKVCFVGRSHDVLHTLARLINKTTKVKRERTVKNNGQRRF